MTAPLLELADGHHIPALGLRTYLAKGKSGIELIKKSIELGYRFIDTAFLYENEMECGQAIREKIADGTIERKDVFVSSKLWNSHHEPEHVPIAFQQTLDRLGLEYLDLYLMHSPMGFQFRGFEHADANPKDDEGNLIFSDVDYVDTWKAMEKLVKGGKVRSIGLSNFNYEQILRILDFAEICPVNNQIEVNPGWRQKSLIDQCKRLGITVTAFSPMGRPHRFTYGNKSAFGNSDVANIGRKYRKSDAQIILRYLIQLGTIPIPYAEEKDHLRQNIDVFDFTLNDEEIALMDTFHSERTLPYPDVRSHRYYPFKEEL
ncbi:1,5-anhydro-D-fructose reductase-like [Uranotaenia lowii]|uniref:1,5-anhydro-D-fructose reductase-like n=1 Tax=Uranotaenia lowii TaxID=190385 RepID=UPI002479D879|nr:1,5-anhydro-D-fructose reductase-like [Uranotaenia lowii]